MPPPPPTGFKLFLMQFKLLLKKNFNVKRRNRSATAMQFLVPLIVNFTLFIISVDDYYNPNGYNGPTKTHRQPDVTTVGGLPRCNADQMPSCVTPLSIVHNAEAADAASVTFVKRVVDSMLTANPHIEPTSVRYFSSSLELNLVLHEAPNALLAAARAAAIRTHTRANCGAAPPAAPPAPRAALPPPRALLAPRATPRPPPPALHRSTGRSPPPLSLTGALLRRSL